MWKLALTSPPTTILKSTHDKLATEGDVARQRTQLDHLHRLVYNDNCHWLGLFLEFMQESLKAAILDQPDGMSVLVETLGAHLVLPGQ